MKISNISHQAAKALVERGIKQYNAGWVWTFDRRLRCVSSMVPFEDELNTMLNGISMPTYLIRADQGVKYPENVFEARVNAVPNLTIHHMSGGHHAHMDNPRQAADILLNAVLP